MKKGFTIIEMLIAIAVSAFIAAGLFSMFAAVSRTRDSSLSHSRNILVTEALSSLINRDIRMMVDNSLAIDEVTGKKKLKFKTQNSLRFNKSIPADITYYIDDDHWLVRREMNTDVLYDMEMRLIPDVTEMNVEFYNDRDYTKEVVKNAKLLKFHFIINGNKVDIFAARTMGQS